MTPADRRPYTVITPVPRRTWEEAVRDDPLALPTQTPQWADAVRATRGYRDASRLYVWPDGTRLVLPMVRRSPLPAPLAQHLSWPLDFGLGGVLAPDGEVTPAQAGAVITDLARRSLRPTYLRPSPLADRVWLDCAPPGVTRRPRVTQILDLSGGFEDVWRNRFRGAVRNQVRQGERAGLDVERDSTGRLVPVLYGLYQMSVQRWAQQSGESPRAARRAAERKDPYRKFDAVARNLAGNCHVWVASYQGAPAAAIMVLRQGEHAVYWRSAMDKELTRRTRAVHLLMSRAIQDACTSGARYFHLCDDHPGSSVEAFKASFGPQRYHTAGLWLTRSGLRDALPGARTTRSASPTA